MIRSYAIEADVIIRGRETARMKAICALPEADGKFLAAFGLALNRDVSAEDAGMLLAAAPSGLATVDSVLTWLGHIKIERAPQCRTVAN